MQVLFGTNAVHWTLFFVSTNAYTQRMPHITVQTCLW